MTYLGQLTLPDDTVIFLRPDLVWESFNAFAAAQVLQDAFPADAYSPSDGIPGKRMLAEAAKYLHALPLWLAPDPEPVPGRIY